MRFCRPTRTPIRRLRRSSSNSAPTSVLIQCGHRTGRCDRSYRPSRPSVSCRANQGCIVCRGHPDHLRHLCHRRTVGDHRQHRLTLCSATLNSFMERAQGLTEATVKHQPRYCQESNEVIHQFGAPSGTRTPNPLRIGAMSRWTTAVESRSCGRRFRYSAPRPAPSLSRFPRLLDDVGLSEPRFLGDKADLADALDLGD